MSYSLHETGGHFYIAGRERGEVEIGGDLLKPANRTTRNFRKIEGVWRRVPHHGSFDDPALLAACQNAVRKGRQ